MLATLSFFIKSKCYQTISLCFALSVVAVTSVVAVFLLLLHHKAKHSDPEDPVNFLQDPYDQWFQMSDVCNVHSCSHEMWILFLMIVVVICVVWSSQVKCL